MAFALLSLEILDQSPWLSMIYNLHLFADTSKYEIENLYKQKLQTEIITS